MRSTLLSTVLAGAFCLAACDNDPPYQEDLDAMRAATAGFANPATAEAAGYTTAITECMSDAQGGMGYHMGNAALIDGTVQLLQPEVVMYEPQTGGGRVMVGVEYVVPLTASATAPTLMGQTFRRNETFQVWALHAWVSRDNPRGVFADWNPNVSCAAAPAPAMRH